MLNIKKNTLLKQSTVAFTNLRGPDTHFRIRLNSEYLTVMGRYIHSEQEFKKSIILAVTELIQLQMIPIP